MSKTQTSSTDYTSSKAISSGIQYSKPKMYVITEDTLHIIDEYSDSSSNLDFALVSLSTFISLFIALVSTSSINNYVFIILIIFSTISFVLTIVFYLLHSKRKRKIKKIVRNVRKNRIKE